MAQLLHFPGEETGYSWDFSKTELQKLRTTSSHCPPYRGPLQLRLDSGCGCCLSLPSQLAHAVPSLRHILQG